MPRKTNYQPPEHERPLIFERAHKILKVPGWRGAEWDRRIGRWVITRRVQ